MNSYRIKTNVGIDKSIKVQIDQDFEFLEILSLKLLQSQVYTRQCSDYGVVVGRVSINNGFGLPNCKVSIFVPLTNEDELNPLISDLYPYKRLDDINEDGYRYNLLPYEKSYSSHSPTGTFFSREDILLDQTLIEVYEKYYKLNAVTNESGDFMIFGVPLGPQTIHLDLDLSDIGEFSLTPQDLIRTGLATEIQVSGTKFKTSSNLNSLPQIVTINKIVEVDPFWGEEDICNLGITRVDFDLSSELNITIEPTATFMGSLITSNDDYFLKKNCKPRNKLGDLCQLNVGPGEILAIRQTINLDSEGRPILEQYVLDESGQVIDENGTWVVDLPMNLDYVVTNEFGERVLSNDPKVGVPTRAKYRFKIKYNQSPSLSESTKRGYFLVPNVKEWGWVDTDDDPFNDGGANEEAVTKSYAFSLDWADYGNTGTTLGQKMIQEAISCEDRFYPMTYNKVYTVSQMIDFFRYGYNPQKGTIIKNILDSECESETNKFPTNDSFQRFDFLYFIFSFFIFIFKPILYLVITLVHILGFLLKFILGPIIALLIFSLLPLLFTICLIVSVFSKKITAKDCATTFNPGVALQALNLWKKFTNIQVPNLSYPDCEFCSCKEGQQVGDGGDSNPLNEETDAAIEEYGAYSYLSLLTEPSSYTYDDPIGFIMAGEPDRAPQIYGQNGDVGSGITQFFSTSLTLAERINLFNTKAKYFDDTFSFNPGGAVNRIRVQFNVDQNPGKHHYDNTVVVLCRNWVLDKLTPGTIVTFQECSKSKDLNIKSATTNVYGTNSITGTPINLANNVTIQYANPNGLGNTSVVYYITGSTEDALYAKYPIDIEYFQVVTAMTYNNYKSLQGNTNPLPYTLYKRFLNNDIEFYAVTNVGLYLESNVYPIPLDNFEDPIDKKTGDDQVVVFLVRGVDPYSTRTKVSYDLSLLFGYNEDSGSVVVTGDYKLNIPIQGGVTQTQPFDSYKAVEHDLIQNNFPDSTGKYLYYPSFHFELSPQQFSGFTSDLPYYYSCLRNDLNTFQPLLNDSQYDLEDVAGGFNGVVITAIEQPNAPKNRFLYEIDINSTITFNISPNPYRNYLQNEIVDGGSFMYMEINPVILGIPKITSIYYAPSYKSISNTIIPLPEIDFSFAATSKRIIMRSDSLPTSTEETLFGRNSYALQNNQKLSFFIVDDNGCSQNLGTTLDTPNFNGPSDALTGETPLVGSTILQSFECGNMVPLGCYDTSDSTTCPGTSELIILPEDDKCWGNGTGDDEKIMVNGCYVFVTNLLLSLPKDLVLLTEWTSRVQITFAACRNIWSHIFTNNWINGTLFAYAIKNKVLFTSPTSQNPNQASSNYCTKTVILHPPTNNFYYRSSPYKDGVGFIGAERIKDFFNSLSIDYGGNKLNLKTPTTILDMGPKVDYLQEIIFSDEYDGYIMNKLKSTTFNDVSEILNLLIISRLSSKSFIGLLIGGGNVGQFFSRGIKRVDADYAQMISISSELGIQSFEAEDYPDNPGCEQDPIYYNGANAQKGVMGIFFSSDTQLRDFVTPKRTIISPNVEITDDCAFSNFNVFSQEVPFYQWEIKEEDPDSDSIFGSQKNEWYTEYITSPIFFSERYQSLDRLLQSSRYFRTDTSNITKYFKGYIYSVNPDGTLSAEVGTIAQNSSPLGRVITVGAPFHFYFGLRSGKSAFDRFAKKYLDFENIID